MRRTNSAKHDATPPTCVRVYTERVWDVLDDVGLRPGAAAASQRHLVTDRYGSSAQQQQQQRQRQRAGSSHDDDDYTRQFDQRTTQVRPPTHATQFIRPQHRYCCYCYYYTHLQPFFQDNLV